MGRRDVNEKATGSRRKVCQKEGDCFLESRKKNESPCDANRGVTVAVVE